MAEKFFDRISETVVREIATAVKRINDQPPPRTKQRRNYPIAVGISRRQGELTSTLDAPTNGWTDATTATVRVWKPDPESEDDPTEFIEAEGDSMEISIVNRDPSLSGTIGTFVKIEYLNGEWSPYWVGC